MSRIRTIKPQFFTSEDIVGLSYGARLLYIATWCEADREGRFVWKPKTFKLRYFPADDLDMSALAGELIDRGLIVLYGDGCAHIPTFVKHQHINPRESASILPPPHALTTRQARVRHALPRDSDVQGGREGNGKEGDRRVAPCDDATPAADASHSVIAIPLNDGSEYGIDSAQIAEWTKTYAAVDVPQELKEMRAWCMANPARRKTRRGVLAFANLWLAREQDKPSRRSVNGHATDDPFAGGI